MEQDYYLPSFHISCPHLHLALVISLSIIFLKYEILFRFLQVKTHISKPMQECRELKQNMRITVSRFHSCGPYSHFHPLKFFLIRIFLTIIWKPGRGRSSSSGAVSILPTTWDSYSCPYTHGYVPVIHHTGHLGQHLHHLHLHVHQEPELPCHLSLHWAWVFL